MLVFHLFVGFLVRLGFIVYGSIQDEHSEIQYTDVDYKVFSDAARHVLNGGSPYDRHTYRYTPLVSYLMLLNVLHPVCGKLILSLVDLLVAYLIFKILRLDGHMYKRSVKLTLVWLYNPLSVIITTRGNADSVSSVFVIAALLAFKKRNYYLTGLFHGIAIHFRLYPIIFSLPLYFSIESSAQNRIWRLFAPNKDRLILVIFTLLSLIFVTTCFYLLYGYEFLDQSTLYHLNRTDIRHNYSVYFYLQYLSYGAASSQFSKFLMSAPLAILLLAVSLAYSTKEHIVFCQMLMVFILVMFNSVLTCQYFIWYLSLFPLCLPKLHCSLKELFLVSNFWFVSQAAWLLPAYLLEFQSMNTYLYIWFQCLVFFWANVIVLTSFIRNYNTKSKSG